MTTPTENWPKPWMLSIYEAAVQHGFVWVEPISEADAESLRKRLYRIRRRADRSMATFIPPEYHLIMVGQWEAGDGTGRLPIIYNKRPDGADLPGIRPATPAELAEFAEPPRQQTPSTPLDLETLDVSMKPGEIDSFVQGMLNKVKEQKE